MRRFWNAKGGIVKWKAALYPQRRIQKYMQKYTGIATTVIMGLTVARC